MPCFDFNFSNCDPVILVFRFLGLICFGSPITTLITQAFIYFDLLYRHGGNLTIACHHILFKGDDFFVSYNSLVFLSLHEIEAKRSTHTKWSAGQNTLGKFRTINWPTYSIAFSNEYRGFDAYVMSMYLGNCTGKSLTENAQKIRALFCVMWSHFFSFSYFTSMPKNLGTCLQGTSVHVFSSHTYARFWSW